MLIPEELSRQHPALQDAAMLAPAWVKGCTAALSEIAVF